MSKHTDLHEPLIDRALMGLDLTAEHHLANCPCCRGERENTERALQLYAESQREEANRPQSFWEEQATRIRSARASLSSRPPVAAVLAPALALLLVLGLGLRSHDRAQTPQTAVPSATISDHDLLVAVERAVDNGTPFALEAVTPVAEANATVSTKANKKMDRETKSHAE
jgi:predicted anti-sigma-YlaC factor YlaD